MLIVSRQVYIECDIDEMFHQAEFS